MITTVILKIFDLLIGVFDVFMYFYFFDKILSEKKNNLLLKAGHVAMFVLLLFCYIKDIDTTIKLFLITVTGCLFLVFSYSDSILKIVGSHIPWLVVVISSDTFVIGVFILIHGYQNANKIFETTLSSLLAIIMSKIIYVFMLIVIAQKFKQAYQYTKKEILVLGIQVLSCMLGVMIMVENVSCGGKFEISPVIFSVIAVISGITFFVSYRITMNYYVSKEKENEYIKIQAYMENQANYYESKKEAESQIRRMYHDLRHHIDAIEKIQSSSEVKDYIDEMKKVIKPIEYQYNTGNQIIDLILHEKKKLAEEKGIDIEINNESGCLKNLKTIYLCTIFSNAFDNAIEACDGLDENKEIHIKIGTINQQVTILFENNFKGERNKYKGYYLTTKVDKRNHGLGLKSIHDSVEKCNGKLTIETKNNVFSLFIMFS